MSFAVRDDGQGWRAVNVEEDLLPGEYFSEQAPLETVFPPSSIDEVLGRRDQLLAMAANRMGPLQDAIDTDIANAGEVEQLKLWKLYRVALNRLQQQPGFPSDVDWPQPPDQIPSQ